MGYALENSDNIIALEHGRTDSYWKAKQWNDFDPSNLTCRISEAGNLSGNFDAYEAMALAGEIIILLSQRDVANRIPSSGLHTMVATFLENKGHVESATIYQKLYKDSEVVSFSTSDDTESDLNDSLSLSSTSYSPELVTDFLNELEEFAEEAC